MKIKKFAIPAAIMTTVVAGILFTTSVSAQNSDTRTNLAQKLAEKFNLNQDEVQTFLDQNREEERAQRQAEHKARMEERLDQAVTDGTITSEQKQLLLDKQQEMENLRESYKDLDPQERRDKMEQARDEFEIWAEQNGIDLQSLMLMGGPGFKGHHGRMMGRGNPTQSEG